MAGRRAGKDSLELESVDEESVRVNVGCLRLSAGEEGCDLDSGFGDLAKTGDPRAELQGEEANLREVLVAEVDGGRAGDSSR